MKKKIISAFALILALSPAVRAQEAPLPAARRKGTPSAAQTKGKRRRKYGLTKNPVRLTFFKKGET